jgi:hypothetical protein
MDGLLVWSHPWCVVKAEDTAAELSLHELQEVDFVGRHEDLIRMRRGGLEDAPHLVRKCPVRSPRRSIVG